MMGLVNGENETWCDEGSDGVIRESRSAVAPQDGRLVLRTTDGNDSTMSWRQKT